MPGDSDKDVSPAFSDPKVARAFDGFPEGARSGLLRLRALIFEVAAETEGVGALQETLKWGQPAYLTPATKSGSTIRLGPTKQGGFAIYAHCRTSLISDFRATFPDDFAYEGNRAIHFQANASPPLDRLRLFVKSALTYHLK